MYGENITNARSTAVAVTITPAKVPHSMERPPSRWAYFAVFGRVAALAQCFAVLEIVFPRLSTCDVPFMVDLQLCPVGQ